MWTKHKEEGLGLNKPYYMKRKDAGSMADYMAVRERVWSGGRRVTRWALYDLNGRRCRLMYHCLTLRELKKDVDGWCLGYFGKIADRPQ